MSPKIGSAGPIDTPFQVEANALGALRLVGVIFETKRVLNMTGGDFQKLSAYRIHRLFKLSRSARLNPNYVKVFQ